MIRISDKSLCSGCSACVTACPKQCIVLRRDREGFDYPVANPDLCIGCGLCERICPVLHPVYKVEPLVAYAARSKDDLLTASSGGVFPLLAEEFVSEGGTVCGAKLDESCDVVHCAVSEPAGLDVLRGSKYVQSDLYSIFEDVKAELEGGGNVLFSGTPCQVAGLKSYLGKDYEGLLTVDLACHGVPGPGLWTLYRKAVEEKYGDCLENVVFRDKTQSWRHYDIRYGFKNASIRVPASEDPYMALFFQDMTLRPSCYECRLRNGRSGSDITLADLWNVPEAAPGMNDDRGASGVLVNTPKGQAWVARIASGLQMCEVGADLLKAQNGGFAESVLVPERRAEFFKGIHSTRDLYGWMKSFVVRKPLILRLYRSVRSALSKFKRRLFK